MQHIDVSYNQFIWLQTNAKGEYGNYHPWHIGLHCIAFYCAYWNVKIVEKMQDKF